MAVVDEPVETGPILIVEDDPAHARLITRAFRSDARYETVDVVGSLVGARTWLSECQPALVIADLLLPDGRGTELIVDPESEHRFPVVVMTAHGDEQVAVNALRAGAQDYVVKSAALFEELPLIADRVLREWGLVAARRRAEQAREESEERLRSTLASMSDAVLALDSDGRLLDLHLPDGVRVGLLGEARLGEPVVHLLPTPLYETVKSALESGDEQLPFHGVQYHIDDGTTLRWFDARVSVRRASSGRTDGVTIVTREFTDAVRAQETQQELERQLARAQTMEAVGQLAGGIAHDFNNILTVIGGHAEIVASEVGSDPSLLDSLRNIQLAQQRAADLVKKLLVFGRVDMAAPERIDLGRVVSDLESVLRSLLRENNQLVVECAGDHPAIFADEGQVEQVILNLVTNARDALGDSGVVKVAVSAVSTHEPIAAEDCQIPVGEYVMLTVGDNGTGMSEATRERAFEPFFTTKPHGQGTGLGLASVFWVVKGSHGYVTAESSEGAGTEVRIYLPTATDPASMGTPGSGEKS